MPHLLRTPATLVLAIVLGGVAAADETRPVQLAGGELVFDAPIVWPSVEPANRLIEQEISVNAPEGSGLAVARLTVMTAGGSVEANIARWVGQFQGTEGGADRSGAKIDKLTIDGAEATLVDVSGTYLESAGGPFGPKTPREGYRLLGAIVPTAAHGNYFFKLVGPAETVEPAADAFREMVATLRRNP